MNPLKDYFWLKNCKFISDLEAALNTLRQDPVNYHIIIYTSDVGNLPTHTYVRHQATGYLSGIDILNTKNREDWDKLDVKFYAVPKDLSETILPFDVFVKLEEIPKIVTKDYPSYWNF